MHKIDIGRVIIAGLVAGIVSDALGYLVDGILLQARWSDGMARLGLTDFDQNEWIWFSAIGLVSGIVLIWIYAAIRPRFGAGVKTAILAGLAVWVIGSLLPNASFMYVAHLFSRHLAALTTAGALVETLAGAIVGAAIYKE